MTVNPVVGKKASILPEAKRAKAPRQTSLFDHINKASRSSVSSPSAPATHNMAQAGGDANESAAIVDEEAISTNSGPLSSGTLPPMTEFDRKVSSSDEANAGTMTISSTSGPIKNTKIENGAEAMGVTPSVTAFSSPSSGSINSTDLPGVPRVADLSILSERERELLSLELAHLSPDWMAILLSELRKPYFLSLKEFLQKEVQSGRKVFPPPQLIYTWAKLCPFDGIKVVLLGQDPYHNDGQAMGLCFSVPRGTPLPGSLQNIYKELKSDLASSPSCPSTFEGPKHGDLSEWAKQGILLLNTCLTVRAHEAASHAGRGWEPFTDAVIRAINIHLHNVVFILWGNYAQKKASMIDKERHLCLMGVHPSPLSASRGFFGCRHFTKTNEYLVRHGKEPINWNKL